MKNKNKIFSGIILIIILIFSYKIYAPFTIEDFKALNMKNIKKVEEKVQNDNYRFAVVGNIKNSITIFDKKILADIKDKGTDFIISTGNNVSDSGEGKYRVLYRTLERMKTPFITGVGKNEIENEGYRNYYKYFGPFYYSFDLNNSYFIFLDTTGYTYQTWIKEWLEKELEISRGYDHRFIIMNSPPVKMEVNYLIKDESNKYINTNNLREYYQEVFSKYNVDAVFSSNLEIFEKQRIKGVDYYISGGAGGGLIMDNDKSFYHYLEVKIDGKNINYELRKINPEFMILNPKFAKILESGWIVLQSFLYTNYLNILIVLLIIIVISFVIYIEINKEVNYYRKFDVSSAELENKKLNIAMFTNNYFPFIGGVPISIKRLSQGLRDLGHTVYIFAPEYPDQTEGDEFIIRCKSLYNYENEGFKLPIVNIFSKKIKKEFNKLDIDIVHIHHPFWLGKKGLKLARNKEIPAVLTYHTRLERYAHYIPNILMLRKFFKNRISHSMIKRFSNKCNAVFAPTDTAREYLRNIGVSSYVEVLPTGIDLSSYDSIKKEDIKKLSDKYEEDGEIVLFTVSRLSKEKNLYFMLKALKEIKKKGYNYKCIIAGDGSEKENLEKFVMENGLQKRVEFLGKVDNNEITKFYIMSDLFIFTSTSETQGMVLLEAMAGNTPVVAVRSSGIDDVIENGYNGFKTKEDIEIWSEKVIKLIKNEKLLKEMSENSRKTAENNSIEVMAKKAEKTYKKIKTVNK
ncbi:MAG: glycosyltransferase [Fusobacteriota bacterium]